MEEGMMFDDESNDRHLEILSQLVQLSRTTQDAANLLREPALKDTVHRRTQQFTWLLHRIDRTT
jgi:hypothetical protein